MTRSSWGAVETHPPKSPPQAALYRSEGHEGGVATRRPRGGRPGDSLAVIVLRSDPLPKQEVKVDRSHKYFLPHDLERPIEGKSSADEGGPAAEPLLLKAGDVAKLLGLGRSKVFAMLAVGELPVIRIGRSVRVPRAALEDWIAEHTQHASGRSGDAGPLFADVEDRDGVPGAGPSPLTRGVPREPLLGLDGRRASRRLGRRPEKRRPL